MKKITALILALVMMFALVSCGGGGSGAGSAVSNDIPEGKQIPNDAVLNVTVASHASWPYEEDWAVWRYIKEAIGGTVNVTAIPSADFGTKFPLIMATPESLPDVFGFQGKPSAFSDYCEQQAFVALDDYSEYLTDYNEFWDSLPEKDQWMRNTRKAADGKVYYAPIYGMERSTNVRSWLYRKDIFEKHGLETPETIDELYSVSKKLKKLYPTSYPFALRSGLPNFNVIGSSWKPNFHYGVYYDFDAEKWMYGATEPYMLEMVTFFNKMVKEELVPADFLTINTTTWQELISTDRGFIMPEYQVRIDFFNNIARANNPEYTIAAMKPPHADNGVGVALVNKFNNDPMGFSAPNTGDAGRIANAMRYINWFYSDEGAETVSWGKEGETYEVVDGKRQFIVEGEGENVNTLYGFKTIGTYLRVDPAMIDASISEEQAATTDFMLEYTYPELDPSMYIQFSADEAKIIADYDTSLKTVVEENLQKFIIGQRPLSEWDSFQEEIKALPINELLAMYEDTYNKYK